MPANLLESGLLTLHSVLSTAQRGLSQVAGRANSQPGAPLDGPSDVDLALSDFANRVARIVRYTSPDTAEVPRVSTEIADAARRSFSFISLTDPKNVALPAQLALSAGTLAVQSALRGLATFEYFGPSRIQQLVRDVYEMYTELPLFIGLEYREVVRRMQNRLNSAPDDHKTRIELGEILGKCGLYEQSEGELLKVPQNSSWYARSRHEAAVSMGRAGKLRRAAELGVEAMTTDASNERARYWLWLTARKMGAYPDFVPASHRMEVVVGYDKPVVEFTDIAAKIGLDKTSGGRGIAIFDYDNDGYLDIAIAAAHGGCSLYHNNGDGTFTDVSIGSGIDKSVNTFALLAADYNNDGFVDLYITRLGFYGGEGELLRNNGDGTFTNVTEEAGLTLWGPAFSASWVDYDNDGFLDLYICNNLGGLFDRKTPNRLFRNNGDGTFTETTEQAGLKTVWPTIGCAWGDYDNDGYQDLFVSNAMGRSQLYHNNGDGSFTDVSEKAGVTEQVFGTNATFWDYDNDGWLDIVQFVWSDHEDVIHTMRFGEGPPDASPARVYRNNRDGTFTQVNRQLNLNGAWGTMSAAVGDVNNDGYVDFVLGNGSPKMDRLDPMVLLEFDGARFHNTTFAAGLAYRGKSHGVNIADLFGDGRMSMLVAAGGQYPGDLLTTSVYYANKLAGNYLNVRLVGVRSNRSAIGARIAVQSDGRRQYREVSGGTNFGCLPLEQHFGFGSAKCIDVVEVRWPSGLVERFEGLAINHTYEFTEGRRGHRDVYAKR
ncbi:MAG TPA: CRTAC1 family protein [Bryobacteraceae bacterium]|nr:CRTAC1 family protein [Bryobacteraceae bacterium]